MDEFKVKVEKCIEGLEFISKKALELINLAMAATDEFNNFSDKQKNQNFGELECDVMQQAEMAVLAIDSPQEFYDDMMNIGKESVKMIHDALDSLINLGEFLCKKSEYLSSDSDLRSKLDIAIKIRDLYRK